MKIVYVLIAALLLFAAVVTVKIIRDTVADRIIRRGWQISAAVTGLLACVQFYFCFFSTEAELTVVANLASVILAVVLIINAFLLKETIAYIKEVNTINGINVVDPVSGAFNRTYLEQRLDTEVARCHRYGSPLGVVGVEIIDFIHLNDEYGHQGSAIATSKIATRLKSLLRETDVVATFSAGRFVLVLPDTPEGSLSGLVNRLRSAIDGLVVIDGAGIENSVKVNVIFGTSHCELKTRSGQQLIHQAFSSIDLESPYNYLTRSIASGNLCKETL